MVLGVCCRVLSVGYRRVSFLFGDEEISREGMMRRRSLMLSAAGALLPMGMPGNSRAQAGPRTYAVLSLVGDRIDIVTFQLATGSSLDRNVHRQVPLGDGVFDESALEAAKTALEKSDAGAQVQLFAVSAPSLFDNQQRLVEGGKLSLPAAIDAAVRADGATHLLLITKYRSEAAMSAEKGHLGAGKLEGLGFYVDHVTMTRRSDTDEIGEGFIAPFVYIKASLFDLKRSLLLREQSMTGSHVRSASRAENSSDPWDALTPAAKVSMLRSLIEQEIARVVPELVSH